MNTQLPNKPFLPVFSSLEAIKQNWGLFLGLGILFIILGFIAVGAATATSFVTIFFLGFLLVISGIVKLIQAFWVREWSGFFLTLLGGLLYGIAGVLFLAKPVPVLAGLTLVIGLLFLVSGIFKMCLAFTYRHHQWGWVLFSGIISFILGLLVVSEWPAASLWVIGLFVGIDLIFYGWMWVILSLGSRQVTKV